MLNKTLEFQVLIVFSSCMINLLLLLSFEAGLAFVARKFILFNDTHAHSWPMAKKTKKLVYQHADS